MTFMKMIASLINSNAPGREMESECHYFEAGLLPFRIRCTLKRREHLLIESSPCNFADMSLLAHTTTTSTSTTRTQKQTSSYKPINQPSKLRK